MFECLRPRSGPRTRAVLSGPPNAASISARAAYNSRNPSMPVTPGTQLGPYLVIEPLGSGGMGDVFKARDTRLDRAVAIKTLKADAASDPDRRARFEREARAISAAAHPHICMLYDVGSTPGDEGSTEFLVMVALARATRAARLAPGQLPVA